MTVLNIFILPAEAAAHHHEEHRDEEDSQYGRGDHTAHYTCTDRVLRTGACTGANNQRHYAEDERQRGHQD